MSHPTFSGAVSLAVHMAVGLAVHMAVSLAVYTAVQMTVSLAVQMAVSLAVQMAVSLAVQMGQMKKMLNLSGKPSFTPTVMRGATSNSMRCSRFSLSQSFALRLCFSEANPTTTLLLIPVDSCFPQLTHNSPQPATTHHNSPQLTTSSRSSSCGTTTHHNPLS